MIFCKWKSSLWNPETLCHIRVGAVKFSEGRRIFARISPNIPEKFCASFAYKFFPTKIMKSFFCCDLKNKGLYVFIWKLWASFLKSNNVGHHFLGFSTIFPRFLWFWPVVQGFCPYFDKLKLLGLRLHPCTPASYTIALPHKSFAKQQKNKKNTCLSWPNLDLPQNGLRYFKHFVTNKSCWST